MDTFSNLHFWRYFQAFFYLQTMESKSSSSLGLLSEDMAVLRLSSVTVMMIMIMMTMVEMMTMMRIKRMKGRCRSFTKEVNSFVDEY